MRCFLIIGACVLCLSARATDDDIAPGVRPLHMQVNPDVHIAEENAEEIERVNDMLGRRAAQAAAEANNSTYNEYVTEGVHVPS